jgi:hypothetical protein
MWDPQARPARLDRVEQRVPKAHKERRARLETKEILVLKDFRVRKEILALWVQQVRKGLRVILARWVPKAPRASMEPMDPAAPREYRVRSVLGAQPASRALLATPDPKVIEAKSVRLVPWVQPGHRVHKDKPAGKARKAIKALLATLDRRALKG